MAVTVRQIVRGALKKLGVLAIGREPTAAQAQDALEVLQGLYRELVGLGVFGRLVDVLVKTDTYSAREQERVVCNNSGGGVTVTLPVEITQSLLVSQPYYRSYSDPWATDWDYGHGGFSPEPLPRPPRDGACIVVVDVNSDFEKYYLYDANRAFWVLLDGLTLDNNAPLSGRYQNGLMAVLAMRMAAPFGVEPSPVLQGEANAFRYSISMKSDRSRRETVAEYF
jgi:hypothetical protein